MLLSANLNALPFDYVTRQKLQGQTLNRLLKNPPLDAV